MTAAEPNPYDQLAYVGRAYPETHPDRLATIAVLYGLNPAPVRRCRVLEIGCGDAANLLPMAYTLPESEFLGIDLAAKPIAQGRAEAAALGLRNLRLEAMDILDFPADAGEFDYIVAHGVYSWTPPAVRDAVLGICERHLAAQGVAFVSFNAQPGYHFRGLEREMMLYHIARVGGGTEAQQAQQALSVLRFVSGAQQEDNPYKQVLADALENTGKRVQTAAGVAWFHHDVLAPINQPFYLHEFMRAADGHALQFLSEANFRLVRSANYPPEVAATLQQLGDDPVAQEQYMDFIACASFRRVLLCRAGAALDRSLDPARLGPLYVSGDLQPRAAAVADGAPPQAPETFQAHNGEITLNHPLAKAAARLLGRAWPHGYSFAELLATARTEGGADTGTAEELGQLLITLYGGGMVELSTRAPDSTLTAGERPEASALVRQQIRRSPVITTLRHKNGALEGKLIAHFVSLLDGTRDRAALRQALRDWVESGEAARECAPSEASPAGEPVPTPEHLEETLEEHLQKLAQLELLVR